MMDLVQRAAMLNLEGASYLEEHDEQQALVSFNNSLEFMSRAASNYYCTKLIQQVAAAATATPVQTPVEVPVTADRPNTIPLMAIPKPHEQEQEMEVESFKADDDSADENPQHFVYTRALVFNPEVARSPVDSLFYSAVVIFNTALCFHQAGGDIDPAAQLKAASLYDICLELLKESATRFNCSHIIISAMNNKACIHLALGDYIKANNILDQLLSVMLSTKGIPPAFSETDMEGILHNILLLKASCISPAA